jgi:CDP-6-deoxy-D-xylo-4-hexulose-3-dehydrase
MAVELNDPTKSRIYRLVQERLLASHGNPGRYWYPLSSATYGAEEILEALESMCSFKTSMSEKTAIFEREFSRYQQCADAVMVNSGSSADFLLGLLLTDPLLPLVDKGSEVVVPVVTWPTQIWSMMMAGLKVRLVDVNPATLNLDLDDLEESISPQTRVLFVTHLMGNPCQMDRILEIAKRYGLFIIEDCCEALGATWGGRKVGNFGVGGAFSFFFSHHITTMEGGAVAVNSTAAAEQVRILRAHGWVRNVDPSHYNLQEYSEIDRRYAFVNWGLNVRPMEVQAGFGIHQLAQVNGFAARRAHLFARFQTFLAQRTDALRTPRVERDACPSWLALPLMVEEGAPFSRKEITAYLENSGVETRPIVAGNLAKQPVARRFPEFLARSFHGATQVHEKGFYIGLSPVQTEASMDRLIEVFDSFLSRF